MANMARHRFTTAAGLTAESMAQSTAYGEAWDYYAANPDGFTKIKTEGSR
jgi:hypothetical protein